MVPVGHGRDLEARLRSGRRGRRGSAGEEARQHRTAGEPKGLLDLRDGALLLGPDRMAAEDRQLPGELAEREPVRPRERAGGAAVGREQLLEFRCRGRPVGIEPAGKGVLSGAPVAADAPSSRERMARISPGASSPSAHVT